MPPWHRTGPVSRTYDERFGDHESGFAAFRFAVQAEGVVFDVSCTSNAPRCARTWPVP